MLSRKTPEMMQKVQLMQLTINMKNFAAHLHSTCNIGKPSL